MDLNEKVRKLREAFDLLEPVFLSSENPRQLPKSATKTEGLDIFTQMIWVSSNLRKLMQELAVEAEKEGKPNWDKCWADPRG